MKFLILFTYTSLLAACATLTPAQTSAINATETALAQQIPAKDLPYVQAAEVIYSAYQGQPIPASSISTGNTQVNSVLQKVTTTAPVVAGDISVLQQLDAAFSKPVTSGT